MTMRGDRRQFLQSSTGSMHSRRNLMTMRGDRRQFLQAVSGLGCLGLARGTGCAQEKPVAPRRLFCLQTYSYSIRHRQERGAGDPLALMQFTGRLGFAGVQLRLGERNADYLAQVRAAKARLDLSLEGIVTPPMEENDSDRFEAELRACQAAGIDVVRMALLSGRRYETFRSAEDFRRFKTRCEQALTRVARLAARHRIKVAVENHKDFRAREFADLIQRPGSEFLGVCLDTGNNIALLEDPWFVVDTLAPLTFTVHLKDMAVESAEGGFLLAEVPLGRGLIDLNRLVRRIHEARPRARFHLEMITRNPLPVPCLGDDYWRTLAEVPGIDLARTLRLVRRHARPANELPRINTLDVKDQVQREHEHVLQSLRYGRERLFRGRVGN
jgi:sugar phosphate isomerase/epimerase